MKTITSWGLIPVTTLVIDDVQATTLVNRLLFFMRSLQLKLTNIIVLLNMLHIAAYQYVVLGHQFDRYGRFDYSKLIQICDIFKMALYLQNTYWYYLCLLKNDWFLY